MTPLPRPSHGSLKRCLAGLICTALAASLAAQPVSDVEAVVVTATRSANRASDLPVTVESLPAQAFTQGQALTVDESLKQSAAFSLFRRTGSLMANPTAQGVSLRNLGPSGAGRTLVLFDGVPLNDPFGGWVTWTKLPRLTLGGAEIVRGGGSSAWGSAALGGTIQLVSADLAERVEPNGRVATDALVELGDASTRSAEILATSAAGQHHLQVAARAFTTDGFWRVPADVRGSIDRRTDNDHRLVQLRWQHASTGGVHSELVARYFDEDRGNGTPFQRNSTRETFVGGRSRGTLASGARWAASAYAQEQRFSQQFSGVRADRAQETPALDQYAVPSDAAGAAFVVTWDHDANETTTAGADVRWVRGETREAFFLQENVFTRRRVAGGEQQFAGAFVQHARALTDNWRGTVGLRVDHWKNRDGRRREWEAASGATLRDEVFERQDELEWSPSLGLVWRANDTLRLRGAAYRAFRVPTLNEYYRPFRVGNVITEANPRLAEETLTGVEIGADIALQRWHLSFGAFHNDLRDAVANVTLGEGPATIPDVGFVPAGGLGRQRRNLSRIKVQGLEFTARWSPGATVDVRFDALVSDATVRRAAAPAANLAGRRLAQVPEFTAVAGLSWRFQPRWSLGVQARHVSEAYEDDLNTLTLGAATTVDLRLARSVGRHDAGELFVTVENLTNTTIEAGRDADGRVDLGPPRFAHAGVRWRW